MADETPDIVHHEQLAIVLRYLPKNLSVPVETFVGLRRLLKTDAQSFFDKLIIH